MESSPLFDALASAPRPRARLSSPSSALIWPGLPEMAPIGGAAGEKAGYLFDPSADLLGHRTLLGFGDDRLKVALLDKSIANAIIMAKHYSGRVYSGTTEHLGVWLDEGLAGVLQFGFAMNPASADSVVAGTLMHEYRELNRMWLDDRAPRNSESKALSFAIRLLRRLAPSVKWIQSFADERCGLFGTVYQAAGFTYHGEHIGLFWELDGEYYHNSLMTNGQRAEGGRAAYLRANRDRAVRHELRQFRYLRFLQTRFARSCRYPVKPFPKPDYAARPDDERPTRACEDGGTPSGRSTNPGHPRRSG